MKQVSFLTIVLLLMSGPFALAQASAAQATPKTQQSAPKSASGVVANDTTYIVGAEDVLSINVWKEPDFSVSVPVRPDGKISLALVGDVPAAGKTPARLSDDIATALKKYLDSPRVTVTVTAINSRSYFVLGEVNHPGKFPLQGEMNALQAVSAAGGLTQFANGKKIYILRNEGQGQGRIPFNYKAALHGDAAATGLMIKPNDTIVIP
jgi:polysaccharide export outer membrane protein